MTKKSSLFKKDSDKNNEILLEYEKLKQEYKDLEREEKNLKDYLNINVFDYSKNVQQIEDIFFIKNSSMAFLDVDKFSKKINPNIPVLEVNNLTKIYASRRIPSLINVTLKLYLGDVHVVVGPSGSGKTTLFNCLTGFEDYEGEVLVDGKDLQLNSDFSHYEIVGFVSHAPSWDLYSSVEDVIRNSFQEMNLVEVEVQNYIRSSLERLKISYLRHYFVIDLTLLEKRKIQIALALINDPHVVIFDEIFLGLQMNEILELISILNELKREDRSLLFFSHSFDKFFKFANTVSVLSEGKIYYTGSAEEFFLNRVNRYSISTSDNTLAKNLLESVGCKYFYSHVNDVILVSFDGKLILQDFQKLCVEKGVIIYELRMIETSMEDIYPILIQKGNKEAIKFINSSSFFTPLD